MITTKLYLSKKQPSTVTYSAGTSFSIHKDDKTGNYIIPITKDNTNIKCIIHIKLLRSLDSYVKSIWDKSGSALSWERTVISQEVPSTERDEYGEPIPNIQKTFYPSITIKYYPPSHTYTPNPYWDYTLLEAHNPIKLYGHQPPLLISRYSDFEDENELTFNDLLPTYISELQALDLNKLNAISEYEKLKTILMNILRTMNKVANDIPLVNEGSPLNTLLSLLKNIQEALPDEQLSDLIIQINLYISNIESGIDNKNYYWLKSVPNNIFEVIVTNVVARPGEYIELKWSMNIGDNNPPNINNTNIVNYNNIIDIVRFETPLFTGGKIIGKYGEGNNIGYIVEIYGVKHYNIKPTDYFDYKINKWCYLYKSNANLSGEHQEYGSDDITYHTTSALLTLLNQIRIDHGLEILVPNKYLDQAAANHVQDMAARGFFDHINPDGKTPHDRIADAGYFKDISLSAVWEDSENLTTHTPDVLYDSNTNTYSIDYTASAQLAVDSWMASSEHRANLLNPNWTETGLAFYILPSEDEEKPNAIYYAQTFAYRTDGINVGIESEYRLTPFNFKGAMSEEMAISYENDLEIDFSTNFEKVFDMIEYDGEILSVDYNNDTASVQIPNLDNSVILPIFYHCNGEPVTSGGSKAFKAGDTCLVKRLKEISTESNPSPEDFSDAYVIGFTDKLSPCSRNIYVAHGKYSASEMPKQIQIKDNIIVETLDYEKDIPIEFITYKPQLNLTYDDLIVRLSPCGTSIFPVYEAGWGITDFRNHEYSAQCIYKGSIINFDFTNNAQYVNTDEEIQFFNLINDLRIQNNRTPYKINTQLNLASNIYNPASYTDKRVFFNPKMPTTNLTPLQMASKTGYSIGWLDLSPGGVSRINYINNDNNLQEIIDSWTNDPANSDKLKQLLSAEYREIGIGIYYKNGNKIYDIFFGFLAYTWPRETNSTLHFGFYDSRPFAMSLCSDINKITYNATGTEREYLNVVFSGAKLNVTNYSGRYYSYILRDDVAVPFMQQIDIGEYEYPEGVYCNDHIGCKIIDKDEFIIYHSYTKHYQKTGIGIDNHNEIIFTYNTKSKAFNILPEYNGKTIWNYIKRDLFYIPYSETWDYGWPMAIMTIDGAAYIDNNNDIISLTNEGTSYLPNINSFQSIFAIDEYYHLQAVLLHSDSLDQAILYSKHDSSTEDEEWYDSNDLTDFSTYVITKDGNNINIPDKWGYSFFIHL